jgi:hypothetical protein
MPMYGVVFSFKDPFDTKDMRTSGGDAAYDIDIPARDHVLSSSCATRARSSTPRRWPPSTTAAPVTPAAGTSRAPCCPRRWGTSAAPGVAIPRIPRHHALGLARSSWAGVSVSTNLVMASLGGDARLDPRPANHNAVALILPHKAMLGFVGGAIGADIYCDRTGILCRTIADCATVLDASRIPWTATTTRDPFTTVPRSSILATPTEPREDAGIAGHAAGMRSSSASRWSIRRAP